MVRDDQYVSIAPGVVYRGLETPHLFEVGRDELYELDADGLAFLDQADGTRRARDIVNRAVLDFADAEGLVVYTDAPSLRRVERGASSVPSLRYLELILTRRCNLRCRHCYLGEARAVDLPFETAAGVLDDFDRVQGLRLLLSGGEPLLYPDWDRLAGMLSGRGYRSVLLTNGYALTAERLKSFTGHEVQVSLDGLEAGHDGLRGAGSFARARRAAELVRESGLDLSVATMIHADNVREMEGLEDLVKELGAREWGLDLPVEAGRWAREGGSGAALLDEAARAMGRAFGGSYHGSGEGYACGLHLAAALPSGEICPCGFYADTVLGRAADGLRAAWERKRPAPLAEIGGCGDCRAADDCAGGCRFRAAAAEAGGPDPVMCAAHGQPVPGGAGPEGTQGGR